MRLLWKEKRSIKLNLLFQEFYRRLGGPDLGGQGEEEAPDTTSAVEAHTESFPNLVEVV